jgi:adenine C2-methylase RlmN of 23S rRNA A2503 and tRNA A37
MFPLTLDNLKTVLQNEPAFRMQQTLAAFFCSDFTDWLSITPLPKTTRLALQQTLAHTSISEQKILSSKDQETFKAILTLHDGLQVETVLMKNLRDQWTICVSSQVGCAMRCSFCATGKMGQLRNLDALEIAEQFCFWKKLLKQKTEMPQRISNIVFMGMGEPLLNYNHVKTCLQLWLEHTDVGPNYITVSTVGVLPALEKILEDTTWPNVKIAISLHSADETIRKTIVPSHTPSFFARLKAWSTEYEKTRGARTRPLTFEYVMLDSVNDSIAEAKKLAQYLKNWARVKVNLIPFNTVQDTPYLKSKRQSLEQFQDTLKHFGVFATIRDTKGQDIEAACGQLIVSQKLP